MSRHGAICVSCLAWVVSILCSFFCMGAYAAEPNATLSSISNEFWLGLVFAVVSALIGAYVNGMKSVMEKRMTSLEYDSRQQATQISLMRETMLREHPTREETTEHRERVEGELLYIRQKLDEVVRSSKR